ncbi:uncharacterized protein BYT42DRAFT_647245 [Radiomyces spectabilis]|uniref:uncharacterized protein n=1 Tax=Radiomyces spectabilis TaxID=64574 RepID=UPI00221E896F|nr:uncharacterized protein BYT42DRAFT_647245 [Radiomyces spectabilis]KAI8371418.1 hypothetical protein BYT42DRAFT_647245 [Radiomyces spectabilis]
MKKHALVPIKAFRKVLARKALVLCDDEYRTSKVCSHSDSETVEVRDEQILVCKHKKKTFKRKNVDKRPRSRCLDDEGNIISYSSVCNRNQRKSCRSILAEYHLPDSTVPPVQVG